MLAGSILLLASHQFLLPGLLLCFAHSPNPVAGCDGAHLSEDPSGAAIAFRSQTVAIADRRRAVAALHKPVELI